MRKIELARVFSSLCETDPVAACKTGTLPDVYSLLEETGIRLAVLEGLSVIALMTASDVPSQDVQKVVTAEAIYRLERLLYDMDGDEEIQSFTLAVLNGILAHGVVRTFDELEYYRQIRLGLIQWVFKHAGNKSVLERSALRFLATVCSSMPEVSEGLVYSFLHESRRFVELPDYRTENGEESVMFQVMAESIATILQSRGSGIVAAFPQVLDFAMYISERGALEDSNAAKLVLMAAFSESGSALGPHVGSRMVPLLRSMIPPILDASSDEELHRSWFRTVACVSRIIEVGLLTEIPSIIHLFQISFQSYAYVSHQDRVTLLQITNTLVDRCESAHEVAVVLAQGGGLLGLVAFPEPEVSDLVCAVREKAERLGFKFTL
jgi:hypothetical protein